MKLPEFIQIATPFIIAAWPVLGAIGTALEKIGAATGKPWLEKLGQRIEALTVDLPKLWRGSRLSAVVNAKAKAFEKGGQP